MMRANASRGLGSGERIRKNLPSSIYYALGATPIKATLNPQLTTESIGTAAAQGLMPLGEVGQLQACD